MITSRFRPALTATWFCTVFAAACFADSVAAVLPPRNAVVMITVGTASPPASTTAAPSPFLAGLDLNPARWIDIKDCTNNMRASFFAGFKRLEAKVAEQFTELTAIRASLKSAQAIRNFDFALKEMGSAQSQLKSTGESLSKATPQMWDQQKIKVGQAWARTQDAYGKAKASPTQ